MKYSDEEVKAGWKRIEGQTLTEVEAPKARESEVMKKKRDPRKSRHAKNIAKNKMSAAYWADGAKW